jgi:hypothetical protein
MGLLDYFKAAAPSPQQQMAAFANALRPQIPTMIARPAAQQTVYTAPRVTAAPRVAAAAAPRAAAPRAAAGGGISAAQRAANTAQAKASAAQAKAEKEAKDRSRKENEATKALVDQQVQLSGAFGKQRDTKLSNISNAYTASDSNLLKGYDQALGGLLSTSKDNDRGEADST